MNYTLKEQADIIAAAIEGRVEWCFRYDEWRPIEEGHLFSFKHRDYRIIEKPKVLKFMAYEDSLSGALGWFKENADISHPRLTRRPEFDMEREVKS